MPLSILSTDGSPEQANGYSLPHNGPELWTRPYRPGPCRVAVAALMLMLCSYLLIAAVVVTLSGSASSAGAMVVGAVVLVAATLRLVHTGVWLSSRGLRRVRLLRTTTLRWDRVAEVRTSQQPVRWLGLPRTVQGQAVLVVRADRRETWTVITDHNADFLRRGEAFDRAADAIEDWAGRGR